MIMLLVEDEKELLMLFKTILEVGDHGILLAYNEIEAKKINNFHVDLIVQIS